MIDTLRHRLAMLCFRLGAHLYPMVTKTVGYSYPVGDRWLDWQLSRGISDASPWEGVR